MPALIRERGVASAVAPVLPEHGEGEERVALGHDRVGPLGGADLHPFVKAARRDDAAPRLEGVAECWEDRRPSARALIILAPVFRSFAQRGTKPQRSESSELSLVSWLTRTVSTGSVGAMLKRAG
jgi:hypothetical protein